MARTMRNMVMTLLVVCMIITANTAGVFAAKTDDLTEAQKKSSYGFFVWLSENADTAAEREDAAIAAELLTNTLTVEHGYKVFNDGHTTATSTIDASYEDLVNNLQLGEEYDSTSLECLEDSVNFITTGNQYRAKENLPALKVSSALMAMGELNVDIQDWVSGRSTNVFGHTTVFKPLENLAVRMLDRSWAYGTVPGKDDDPYQGWYTEEKANYDSNNGYQTGHYKTLTDRQGAMLITGFGVRHRYVDTQTEAYYPDGTTVTVDCTDHYKYYSQIFSTMSNGMYDVTTGVTPAKYLEYLDRYSCIAGEHDLVKTEEVGPTCVSAGNFEYYTCSKCGKFFSDKDGKNEVEENSWILPATGLHSYDDGKVTQAATCTTDGVKTYTCSVCGKTMTEPIEHTGHNYGNWVKDSDTRHKRTCANDSSHVEYEDHQFDEGVLVEDPDCTSPGKRKYTCTVCGGDVIKDIPALGHNMRYVPRYEAECEEDGCIGHYECKLCGRYFSTISDDAEIEEKDIIIPALGHDLSEVAEVPAKCEEPGTKKHYTCSRCDKIFLDEEATQAVTQEELVIPQKGHDYGTWEKVDDNEHKMVCKNDSTHVKFETHTWNSGVVTTEPGCTDEGVKTYTCTGCGAEKTEPITALGHEFKFIAAKEPKCEEAGNIEHYKCDRCGKCYEDKAGQTELSEEKVLIKATGHDFGEWETAGTTEHKRTCKNDPSHVETEAHKWNAGTVTKEATETEEGEKAYECTVCGEKKTETIPKVQPEPAPVDPIDPTKEKGKDGTPYGEGASIQAAEKAIFDLKSDSDPKGTKVAPMLLKSTKQTKTSITLSWKKPAGATKFVLYGNKCGTKNKMKKLKTLSGTKLTLKKILTAKIKKGTYYKFIVVATDKTNHVVSTSKFIHVATKGGKVGNFKSISTKAKKNKVTIKKGKSFKLAGKGVAASKKLKVKPHVVIRYESSKTAVATVSGKGVIKGIKKGTAYVYAYGQNGTVAKIKVTVK